MSSPNLPGLDPQRVIVRLRHALDEAQYQWARYAALCDQLIDELNKTQEDSNPSDDSPVSE